MEIPFPKKPLDNREPSKGSLKKFERPVRLMALMLLCVLVWYFSYDQGRQTSRTRVARMEAENLSLREKVTLLEEEVKILRSQNKADAEKPKDQALQMPESSASRLTVKLSENKGAFGGLVVVTLVELDSLNQEALVRIHYRDTGRRVAQLMVPGDLMAVDIKGQAHQLYLDQIKGSLAFFIVDGLPGDELREEKK
ncbi:MAG: hypothetical protein LBE31_07315 [Deltaproteobacteria bacterium]|jgi:hypothetical protein|nr:hypothetical protein [Deltaproteobacteria bacterium]